MPNDIFFATHEIVISSLQLTILLQKFFQKIVKSINSMMGIIQHIAIQKRPKTQSFFLSVSISDKNNSKTNSSFTSKLTAFY